MTDLQRVRVSSCASSGRGPTLTRASSTAARSGSCGWESPRPADNVRVSSLPVAQFPCRSHPVERVQILVQGDLEDRRRALARDAAAKLGVSTRRASSTGARVSHRRVGQEVDPDTVPPLAVLGNDLVLVAEPVEVPAVQRRRVVHAEHVDRLDLKVGVLELWRGEGRGRALARPPTEAPTTRRTWLMTQLRAHEASAPGNTYLFMLPCVSMSAYTSAPSSLRSAARTTSPSSDPRTASTS